MPDRAPARADIGRIVQVFETLTPESTGALRTVYAPDAGFADPFQTVHGVAAIEQVFQHMFRTLDNPRFVVTGSVQQDGQCVLLWDFHFRFRGVRRGIAQTLPGASHLRFDADGLIVHHQDYWDAAHGLYQKLPVIGSLMRWLRNRVNRA